jgi:hypothetical protein
MSIEAMKQALEAFDAPILADEHEQAMRLTKACDALRQAIEQAENQQQIAEDFIKYGASWSKGGKRIAPSEIYAPAQTPVHAIDITSKSIETAVLAEREACAKVCETFYNHEAKDCAEAIRARGSEK